MTEALIKEGCSRGLVANKDTHLVFLFKALALC